MGRKIGAACCVSAVLIPCALIIIGEVFIPQVITSKLHEKLVHDTPEEIEKWCGNDTWAQNVSITLTVFNLTNGKALQGVTALGLEHPKPHLEAVEVEFTQMGKSFDCSSLDDGEKIKYHDWSKWVPTDPSMYDLEFVQVNPAYLGTIGALAPSEAMLLVGLSHHILGSVKQAMVKFGQGVIAAMPVANLTGMGQLLGENLSSAEQIGQVQFGQSGIARLQALAKGMPADQVGFQTVVEEEWKDNGVCTPIELGVFMNDVSAGPFNPDSQLAALLKSNGREFVSFSMSGAEAANFLAFFSNEQMKPQDMPIPSKAPNWAAVIGQKSKEYAEAIAAQDLAKVGEIDAQLKALFKDSFGTLTLKDLSTDNETTGCSSGAVGDFCPLVAAAYAQYLTSYLPEKLFVGCNLLGCADGSCMRDDGTYAGNSGLFTRLTLRQMLHDGNSDKLFAVAPREAVPKGVKLEYNGLLGKYAHMNATLEELLENEDDMTKFSSVQLSGKTNITRVREWVEFQGMTVVVPGHPAYPGWGNDGTPGKPFDFSGMHYLNNQAPQTKKNSPIAMSRRNHKSAPNFGSGINFHLTTVRMPVTLGCGLNGNTTSKCEWTQVKGIQTKKFTVPESLLKTKKAGTITSSCRGSVHKKLADFLKVEELGPTCDYLQRHDGVINMAAARGGTPLAVTHGYLGQTDAAVRNAVSITLPNSTEELHYEAAKDELALFVEPITGAVITGYERLQTNWYIEKKMMDTSRYANVFSTNEVFVWPFMYIKKEPAITEEGANSFKRVIYGAYDYGFHLSMLGVIMCLICAISAAICCKVDTGKAFGRPAAAKAEASASV